MCVCISAGFGDVSSYTIVEDEVFPVIMVVVTNMAKHVDNFDGINRYDVEEV